MRPRNRRLVAGVLTSCLAYALTALAVLPWKARFLHYNPDAPYWVAAGWAFLATHGADIVVSQPGRIGYLNPVYQDGFQWLLVFPILASFVGGVVAVRMSSLRATVSTAIGSYLAVGYLFATFASFFLFRTTTTTDGATVTVQSDVLGALWVFPAFLIPMVFGSLGAWSGQSPLLDTLFDEEATDAR